MNNIKIKFLIIGAQDCENCQSLKDAMKSFSIDYDFLDANADENQLYCDKYNIDELPVIQAIDKESKNVVTQHVGFIHPIVFLEKTQSKIRHLHNLNTKYEASLQNRNISPYKSANMMKQKKGCKNCGNKKAQ